MRRRCFIRPIMVASHARWESALKWKDSPSAPLHSIITQPIAKTTQASSTSTQNRAMRNNLQWMHCQHLSAYLRSRIVSSWGEQQELNSTWQEHVHARHSDTTSFRLKRHGPSTHGCSTDSHALTSSTVTSFEIASCPWMSNAHEPPKPESPIKKWPWQGREQGESRNAVALFEESLRLIRCNRKARCICDLDIAFIPPY